jgi:hypothetical protein
MTSHGGFDQNSGGWCLPYRLRRISRPTRNLGSTRRTNGQRPPPADLGRSTKENDVKAMSPLAILCACSLSVHAHEDIPKGRLGHPLGTYLTIEGVRFGVDKIGKAKIDAHTLLVDTINGKKLDRPIAISIETSGSLPMRERCVFRGYESGRMVGVPFEVARAENLPVPAAVWHFHRYFIITSVVQPAGLDVKIEPLRANVEQASKKAADSVSQPPGKDAKQIRKVVDVFASLKADLIAMSADYPEFADVKKVAIGKGGITHGFVYEHNCGFGGKRGYKDTGPNAVAIGIEVMTFSEFSEKVDTVAMQAPLYRWKKLELVGWPRLHFGKDLPEALVKRLEGLHRKHIDMIEQLDCGALAPGTPEVGAHAPNGS